MIMVCASLFTGVAIGSGDGGRSIPVVIESGSGVETASYIIYKDGDYTCAKNGATGRIQWRLADSATVIQNAVNASYSYETPGVGRVGATVYLAPGNYTIDKTIYLPGYVNLVGAGMLASYLITTTPNVDMINGTEGVSSIKNICFIGPGSGTGSAVHFYGAHFNTVDSCRFVTTGYAAIKMDGPAGGVSGNSWIQNNHIVTAGGYGIYFLRQHDSFVTNNRIEGAAESAFYMAFSYQMSVTDNEFSDSTKHGAEITDTRYVQFTGNWLDLNDLCGVDLRKSFDSDYSNNVILNNGQHGMFFYYIRDTIIHANNVFSNGQSAANTYDGMYFQEQFESCVITDNICSTYMPGGASAGPETHQRYGIYMKYASATQENVFEGNVLTNNVNKGVGTLYAICPVPDWGYDLYENVFMDVQAVSTTYIKSNQALTAATPFTFGRDHQPDVPRTISFAFDSHANITAFTITIEGWTSLGTYATETFTEASGWAFESSYAYISISATKMTSRTGSGTGDTIDMGMTDVLGLGHRPFVYGDIYYLKKNTVWQSVASAQYSSTYGTYDMSVIGLTAGDDYTFKYRISRNILE